MELLRSLWLFLRGILKRFYWLLPAILLDPFDFAERWFDVEYSVPQWTFWVLVGVGFFVASGLTYHELRKQVPDVDSAISALKKAKVVIKGQSVDMASVLLMLKQSLADGVKEPTLKDLFKEIDLTPLSEVLAQLYLVGIVDSQYIDPAPGSPTASRKSLHDLPYYFYRLTDLGRCVVNRLDSRSKIAHRKSLIRQILRLK